MPYLRTRTAWDGEPPLNFLLGGGREVDIEVGQAPVRTHSKAETRAIAAALSLSAMPSSVPGTIRRK